MRVWILALVALAACGDGGDGEPTPGPRREAILTVASLTTAPGQPSNIELRLRTNAPAAALQVEVVTSPDVIPAITGAISTGRAADLEAFGQNISTGRARVVLFDPEGDGAIAAGEGPVAVLSFQTPATAPPGTSSLGLENGLVVGQDEEPFDLTLEPGQVTVAP